MSELTLYPDEYTRVAAALERIQRQFEFTGGSETDRRIFEMAAHNEFGNAGFQIEVNWAEVEEVTPEGGLIGRTGVYMPGIEIIARNKAESETDHDRMRWGIVKGLADGQAGYVREDGRRTEDPIKKIIT